MKTFVKTVFLILASFLVFTSEGSTTSAQVETREKNEMRKLIDDIRETIKTVNPTIMDIKRRLDEGTEQFKMFQEKMTKVEGELKMLSEKTMELEKKLSEYIEKNKYQQEFDGIKQQLQTNVTLTKMLGIGVAIAVIMSIVAIISKSTPRRKTRIFRF